MTTAQAVGAVSREAAEWYAIDWQAINRNVSPTPSAYRAGNEGKQMGLTTPSTDLDDRLSRIQLLPWVTTLVQSPGTML